MALSLATLKAQVLLPLRSGPYTADAAFETRVNTLCQQFIQHLNAIQTWWYTRQGKTLVDESVENELALIAYEGSCMCVFADIGDVGRSEAHGKAYGVLLAAHNAAYGGGGNG